MAASAPDDLLRTSLYKLHLAAGARMVPFGGWEMPVQYGSIIAEHCAVREEAGLFDLSHMGRLYFRGDSGRALLQTVSTNDLQALAPGRAHYSLLCNERGGILDDTVAYNLGDECLLVVNASNRPKILNWLVKQGGRVPTAQVDDATVETTMIGLQGPQAEALLQPLTDVGLGALQYYASVRSAVAGFPALIGRTGYTGEDGFELVVSAADGPRLWSILAALDQPVKPALCGLGARDTLRLEAGMALYGHELSEAVNPYEANLGRVVKLEKGDFVGRETLRALSEAPPHQRLVGFQMVENAVPRQGYPVIGEARQVGEVTSGSYSPSLKRTLGLAYVESALAEPGTELAILIRGRNYNARITALPHYPHRTRRRVRPGPAS